MKAPPEKPGKSYAKEPKGPIVFLWLAAVMVVCAIAAYAFKEDLYMINYDDTYFLTILLISVPAALFFLLCYQAPHIGNRLLGREVRLPKEKADQGTGVTYNVFSDETPSAVVSRHRRRKLSRHDRRRYAAATRKGAGRKK